MGDVIWESYRPELERLYIHEGQKLVQVMEYMESKYGFNERKSQYEKYFKRWGLRKNQSLTPSEGVFIGRRIEKRKRESQKDSEVYINGVEYPQCKLKRSRYNKTFVSTVDGLPNAPSPNTPEGIVVCTPATPGLRLTWNQSLPWLQFSKLILPVRSNNPSSISSALSVTSPQPPVGLASSLTPKLIQRLGSVVPWKALCNPPNINSLSRIVAGLSILMPEESNNQHHTLATRLCSTSQTTTERLFLEFFLLSNNLVSHGPSGECQESMDAHDENVMDMLRKSGWNDREHIRVLLSTREPTAEAIAEKVFASALRQCDLDILRLMLEAGMDPNSRIDTFGDGPLTCLQFAAQVHCVDVVAMVELFLSYGADLNLAFNGCPPLYYAIEGRSPQVCKLLLSCNAIVTPRCLTAAAERVDVDLFRALLNRVTDPDVRSGWQGDSALVTAVRHGKLPMVSLLLARGADINTLLVMDFDQEFAVTTVLGLAVHRSQHAILQIILQSCAILARPVDGLPYVSPLTLAVDVGDDLAANLLLEAGVDIQTAGEGWEISLVERALRRGMVELGITLMRYGAKVHMPPSDKQKKSSALLVAVQRNYDYIVYMLLQKGAPVNDIYEDPPGTVLAAAIEGGNIALLHLLISAGATLNGSKLRAIKDMNTALFLEQRGLLHDALKTFGGRILTSAIYDGMFDLADWLLGHDIDVGGQHNDRDARRFSEDPVTPLQAAITKSPSFVDILLNRGAKVTDYDLATALEYGDIVVQRRILDGFVGPAPIALGLAIRMENEDAIRAILREGADPTGVPEPFDDEYYEEVGLVFVPEDPHSVLELATQQSSRYILRLLLESCAWEKRLIGRALTLAIVLEHTGLIDDLMELGVDTDQEVKIHYPVDSEDEAPELNEIFTPLQAAVKNQQASIAQRLIQSANTKIDYLGEGPGRRTALQHAVENGNMDLINLLLDHGANVNSPPASDGGATALQIAAIQGYLGIARKLIDLDADVNAASAKLNGRTALEGAAEHGRIDMLRLLVDEGASLVGEDGERQFRRAVELAEGNGHMAAARMLKSFKKGIEECGI